MRLGAYEVTREIGRGGVGVVYRGHGPDGREVAIKLLDKPWRDRTRDRFERERRILARLGEDDGFVPLLDAGDSERGPWIAMPFVKGGTLRDRMKNGPMPLRDAVELIGRIALAVGRAHAQGIIHRDLKPENVLFTSDGRPLVSDLGLAKHFRWDVKGASETRLLSREGEFLGTAGYMAPEQMDDAREATPRADVFALGAILYECLAGHPAIRGRTVLQLITAMTQGKLQVPPIRDLRPEVPAWLASAIERALAQRQEDRFEDGAAFARALGGGERRKRRIQLALIAGGGVAAITLAVAAWVGASVGPRSTTPSSSDVSLAVEIVEIDEPADGAGAWELESVLVRGRAPCAEEVRVNGAVAKIDSSGRFEATVTITDPSGELVAVARAPENKVARTRRRLKVETVPDWFRAIKEEERPAVPLPRGVVFGPGPKEYTNVKDKSVLVWVPGGTFLMGSDAGDHSEFPVHGVELAGYFLGKFEITNEQFRAFAIATGYRTMAEQLGRGFISLRNVPVARLGVCWKNPNGDGSDADPRCPVVEVVWADAWHYSVWSGSRLPTEAEWERAASWEGLKHRALNYPWGNQAPATGMKVGNLADETFRQSAGELTPSFDGYWDGFDGLAPVGSFPDGASPVGALDMLGNAWEWCLDGYDPEFYLSSPRRNPLAQRTPISLWEGLRVLRGGSFDSAPEVTHPRSRLAVPPTQAGRSIGFRIARAAPIRLRNTADNRR